MSNHTPGPWRLEKRGGTYIVDKPGDGYITRDVCRMDASTMSAFHQDGNARLITAAPDLLKALEDMVICFERFEDTHTALVMEAARIALGKAVGAKE